MGGSPDTVPAEPVDVHDVDVNGLGEEAAGGEAPVTPAGVSRLGVALMDHNCPRLVELGNGERVGVTYEEVEKVGEVGEALITCSEVVL